MVSKKGIKKTKAEKPVTPAVEPIIEKPNLDPNLVKAVVEELGPEINKKITASFDEIKGIVMSEIQKIQPRPVEQPVMEQPVMEEPVMEQPVMEQQPQTSIPGGLDMILPMLMKLLGEDKPTGTNGLMNMFMETMMRNTMANTARNDGMQDLMMKAAFKKILGEDVPKHITKTTEELTAPFMHYGDKAEAARNAAQNNL